MVQTILNDPQTTAHAAVFLKETASAPETQKALLDLWVHLLTHPDSVREITVLAKAVIANLSEDKVTYKPFLHSINYKIFITKLTRYNVGDFSKSLKTIAANSRR